MVEYVIYKLNIKKKQQQIFVYRSILSFLLEPQLFICYLLLFQSTIKSRVGVITSIKCIITCTSTVIEVILAYSSPTTTILYHLSLFRWVSKMAATE